MNKMYKKSQANTNECPKSIDTRTMTCQVFIVKYKSKTQTIIV